MAIETSVAPAPEGALRTPPDHVIVLFGATGDLARRKLLPGMLHLTETGLMPERFRIICTSRKQLGDEQLRELARESALEAGRPIDDGSGWPEFSSSLSAVTIGDGFDPLADAVARARGELSEGARLLHYLALPPDATAHTADELGEHGLAEDARIIVEKPFGTDLVSARKLNARLLSCFGEEHVFRIDHYLGREAVQNLLAIRFANGMFEPVWNRTHIDHVQIDVPELLSIDMRGEFYDRVGAFRDMVVTHLLQVLSFVAMEPPNSLAAHSLMTERSKVFGAMPPLDPERVIRGQYEGYREIEGVAPDSDTETFVAVEARVDNWRWEGVPFYLRTGKRLAESRRQLTLAFRQPPRRMFPYDCRFMAEGFGFDHLTFNLGDPGTISASFLAKVPGPTLQLGEADMDFSYESAFGGPETALDAYERLIHDVMFGDRTFFTTSDAIERVWEIAEPVLESPPPVKPYAAQSWGPGDHSDLIAPRRWHLPGH